MIRFVLPYPPSVNKYYRTFRGRMLISADGRQYRKRVEAAILEARLLGKVKDMPWLFPLAVTVKLHAPDARRRDIDNTLKALLDALQKAGVYDDDSQIADLAVSRGDVDHKNPRAEVAVWTLTEYRDACAMMLGVLKGATGGDE